MSVNGIEALTSFSPSSFLPVSGTSATDLGTQSTTGANSVSSAGFGEMLTSGIDSLEALTDKAADLSVKAATGDLENIHDYTIAASQAQLATQLTVAVRDKAVAAFQQIMQMQV